MKNIWKMVVRHPSLIAGALFLPGIIYASLMTREAYLVHGDFSDSDAGLVVGAYVLFWLMAILPYAMSVLAGIVLLAVLLIVVLTLSEVRRARLKVARDATAPEGE